VVFFRPALRYDPASPAPQDTAALAVLDKRRGRSYNPGAMEKLHFGDVTVERCVESEGPSFYPGFIFPDWDEDAFAAERRDWIDPLYFDEESGRLLMSLHSYIIRTPHHTILVDTCVGNDKHRPDTKPWHMRQTPFLEDLTAMGVAPEEVDFVMCTHLHVDHIGWNTKLEDGRWTPTFPNAKYLFHETEYAYWEKADMGDGGSGMTRRDAFEDSVLPVMEAGQAVLVEGDHAIDDTLQLEPSPGHSPGHVFLNLETEHGSAVFTGDVMHHPVQIAYPEWNSRFCYDPPQSQRTREAIVERTADTSTLVLAAHFAMPVAGHIVSNPGGNGDRCKFQGVSQQGGRLLTES
jgi:glyoxylase-like metal-dependent hydrolase (beta-lactamase superfamily II)|tara:strand:+ start:134 stop:1177 length:1044 start_codon:yes stop_codon:yes gene_type:complete